MGAWKRKKQVRGGEIQGVARMGKAEAWVQASRAMAWKGGEGCARCSEVEH